MSEQIEGREAAHVEKVGAVTVRISAEAAKLLVAAGGLIVEVRERPQNRIGSGPARPGVPDPGDPLVEYLKQHPLARTALFDETASTLLQCDALEHFEVPMGTKAIGIWMFRRWTPEVAALHGAPRPAATLRRWRAIHPRWSDG